MLNRTYRREIDGLRAIAVLSIILFHAGFSWFGGGFVGVDVFFVLSGYLITDILLRDLENQQFSLARFYERRARRILPALFVVTLLCIPPAWLLMTPVQLQDFGQSLIGVAVFSSNILFWNESGYFEGAAELKPLLHTWSLAVEEQYYILFPLLLAALWRFGFAMVVTVLCFFLLASLGLSEWGSRNLPDANFYLLPFRAWELLAGALCACVLRGTPGWKSDPIAGLGLVMIIASIFIYDATTPVPSFYAILPVGGACLVILFANSGTRVAQLLSVNILVGIGLISYSAYLWHQPLFAFARLQLYMPAGSLMMLLLTALNFCLAILSWHYIEQPFRKKQPLLRQQVQVFSLGVVVIGTLFGLGTYGYMARGFPERMPEGYAERRAMLNTLHQDRQDAIRAGVCHFNERGEHTQIDAFLEQWDCATQKDGVPRLVVWGDSHAASISNALTQNEVQHMQMTGAGCPLTLTAQSEPVYCAALRNRMLDELAPDDWVILANRYTTHEVNTGYIDQVIEEWSQHVSKVVLLTPMPEYPHFRGAYLWQGLHAMETLHAEVTHAKRMNALLDRQILPSNVAVLQSQNLLCGTKNMCPPVQAGTFLYIDSNHISNVAANLFGGRLVSALEDTGWGG
ncbi:MAG: acyltransferase family protein [Litoreibacter sp.]